VGYSFSDKGSDKLKLKLKLLVENRYPKIWLPSKEQQDLRALLRHRHQWVRIRTRIQNALQGDGLGEWSTTRPRLLQGSP
jgi:transposase